MAPPVDLHDADRETLLQRGVRLEVITVAYNVLEGIVALAAAWLAGSVILVGFGVDSFVESISGGVLLWRLRKEQAGVEGEHLEAVEGRAERLVGVSLVLLAVVVAAESVRSLLAFRTPDPSLVGIGLTALSIVTMAWLWRAKHRVAGDLGSRAMMRDVFQTNACFWLSVIALTGLGLNAFLGWWWADPAGALLMVGPILWEAREALGGEHEHG